ncbi:MAG TPA: ABC transporter ATP-binding protein, partial [Ktedonobacteraceae bacterium]|nr:ABC transporter ATP-binding protein [Ktedonobacteraceae bacterium]
MTEKPPAPYTPNAPNAPNAPANPPRPVRLMRGGGNPSLITAAPPRVPQPNPNDIIIHEAIKQVAVNPNDASVKGSSQPVYGNTSYDRRLAKRQRIDEKKLSWQDLRQFGQFVTPFKWQIALAFCLTVAVGLTALPLPFIFHTMLDQVFPRRDVILFIWSMAMLLVVLLLAELLGYLNRNVLGALSRSANLKIIFSFYHHMLRLPLSFYQGLSSTGQVLSRLNEVTSAQQTVIQVLIDTTVNSVLTIIYVAVLFFTNRQLTLAVLAVAPFYIGISLYFNRRMRHLSRQV